MTMRMTTTSEWEFEVDGVEYDVDHASGVYVRPIFQLVHLDDFDEDQARWPVPLHVHDLYGNRWAT